MYDAFEHWKELVKLLCFAEDALSTHKDLFIGFICNRCLLLTYHKKQCSSMCTLYTTAAVLHFQLKEIPEDFFVDIVSRNNFLTTTLQVSNHMLMQDYALETMFKPFH